MEVLIWKWTSALGPFHDRDWESKCSANGDNAPVVLLLAAQSLLKSSGWPPRTWHSRKGLCHWSSMRGRQHNPSPRREASFSRSSLLSWLWLSTVSFARASTSCPRHLLFSCNRHSMASCFKICLNLLEFAWICLESVFMATSSPTCAFNIVLFP